MSKKGSRHADRQFRDQVGDWLICLDRFYAKFGEPDPITGCIPWRGVKNNIGYPFIGVRDAATDKYKMVTGHRVALTIKLGRAIRPGYNANHFVCHRKDCVNPDHLEEGTQREKLDAMIRDGIKGGRPRGMSNEYCHKQTGRTYKYSEAEIQWIRTARPREIANRYTISIARAGAMKHEFRKGYRWLPLPGQ